MECLQVYLSKTYNPSLNYKNQRLPSRSPSHPLTMFLGVFINRLWNISAYINWIVTEELMTFQGILCLLGECEWAENRHFWRKVLRFLFTLSRPRFLSIGQSKNSKVLSSELPSWKCFDDASGIELWRAAHSLIPSVPLGLRSAPPAASLTVSLRAQ